MQELRLVMIVIGAVAIVALLIHGLWTSRKERPEKFSERPIQKVTAQDADGFDQDGVSSVRVVSHPAKAANTEQASAHSSDPLFFDGSSQQHAAARESAEEQSVATKVNKVKDFYHFEDTEEDIALAEQEQALLQEQEAGQQAQQVPASNIAKPVAEPEPEPEQVQEKVLVLNVQAPANQTFRGDELFNCLEQYGMQFGDMDIFHRHSPENADKVIFSVANMINPGTFSISTIHQFTTPGITLFMMLPCYGTPDQNFKLMLKTAQQVADLLGGHVTDDGRNLLTPKRLDEYREIIKEFTVPA